MGKRKNNLFWLSYSDLMTSLFFVMLVLFVLVFSIMQHKANKLEEKITESIESKDKFEKLSNELKKVNNDLNEANEKLEAEASELRKIRAINETLKALQNGGNYVYNESCKRFELKQEVLFQSNSAIIPSNQNKVLINAGNELKSLLSSFNNEKNIKFLIVIEGRAAKHEDNRKNLKFANNVKDLSYSRALSLYSLWNKNGINFNSGNSEVLISGSGFDGLCRYSGLNEAKNKRFIIQIIPYLIK